MISPTPWCAAVLALGAFWLVPLTYDEAYNFRVYVPRSYTEIRETYDAPNNQILYTLLSKALVTEDLVTLWPPLLRLPNFLVALLMLLLVRTVVGLSGRWALPAALALLCASPLTMLYLFVARGYLIGTALLLSSVYLLSRGHPMAFLPAALAVYAVPTLALHLPGVFLLLLLRDRVKTLVQAAACLLLVWWLYLPALAQMNRFRQAVGWDAANLWRQYLTATLSVTPWRNWFGVGLATMLLLGLAAYTWHARRARGGSAGGELIPLTFAATLSYLALGGVMHVPFSRNTIGVSAFTWLGVGAIATRLDRPRFARAIVPLTALSVAGGLVLFLNSFVYPGNPWVLPTFAELSPTPIQRHWSRIVRQVRRLDCVGWAEVTCWGYEGALTRHGIRFGAVPHAQPCVIGRLPSLSERVKVYAELKSGRVGQLCY